MPQADMHAEFRAALVLYGGVSLAIYENGVTRAFFDACRQRGIFAPLMKLVGRRFVVDVIAGSSAGGINGLLLGAALENGTEFSQTANLWRDSGGLDSLLRPVSEAESARSLLRGETYYLEQLRSAFGKLCQPSPRLGNVPPKEIDIYVTGTDLTGRVETFTDAVGSKVSTKDHRLVFHLKHRRSRARLGLVGGAALSAQERKQLQADVLASIARVTSSFPGAFPPFTVEEFAARANEPGALANAPKRIRTALDHLASTRPTSRSNTAGHSPSQRDDPAHALIDGGVLDNKPFGPVLEAIFHRLPSEDGLCVERKLFYVEPNPAQYAQQTQFTPFEVITSSIGPLPMYDSIASDLRRLEQHNARIRRFQTLRAQALAASVSKGTASDTRQSFLYRATLRQSLGCMLLGVDPHEVDAAKRLNEVVAAMSSLPEHPPTAQQVWDIAFHLRRAYYVLYARTSDGEPVATDGQRYRVGRVIKALKLLRDVWLTEVIGFEQDPAACDSQPEYGLSSEHSKAELQPLVSRRFYLLKEYLAAGWLTVQQLETFRAQGIDGLTTETLEALKTHAGAWLKQQLRQDPRQPQNSVETSSLPLTPDALDWLLELLHACVAQCANPELMAEFQHIDECVYPAEFAAEVYELDQVQVVRIAPQDAKLPNRDLPGRAKITGEALGHFAAFLRKDWRTNDIAWGHVDGVRQIIHALLPDSSWQTVARSLASQHARHTTAFSATCLMQSFDDLFAELAHNQPGAAKAAQTAGLEQACKQVERTFDAFSNLAGQGGSSAQAAFQAFRDALAEAGAVAAMGEYVDLIVADAKSQNRAWHWLTGPELAKKANASALDQVIDMKLGSQPVADALPPSLTVQYAGHASLLLWGMLGASLRPRSAASSVAARVGNYLRPLLYSSYFLGKFLRLGAHDAWVLFALGIAGVAFGLGAALAGSLWLALLGIAATLLLARLAHAFDLRPVRTAVLASLLLASIGFSSAFLLFFPQGVALRQSLGKSLITVGTWIKPGQPSSQGARAGLSEHAETNDERPPGTTARGR